MGIMRSGLTRLEQKAARAGKEVKGTSLCLEIYFFLRDGLVFSPTVICGCFLANDSVT